MTRDDEYEAYVKGIHEKFEKEKRRIRNRKEAGKRKVREVFGENADLLDVDVENSKFIRMEFIQPIPKKIFSKMLSQLKQNGGKPRKLYDKWIWVMDYPTASDSHQIKKVEKKWLK